MRHFSGISILLLMSLLGSATQVHALTDEQRQRAQLVVERVNLYRALSGLPPVVLDEALSDGCILHANYLKLNPDITKNISLDLHLEDPARPGYTPEGAAAGASSDITVFRGLKPETSMLRSIEFDYNSYYHRGIIIAPGLSSIGFGDLPGGGSTPSIGLLRIGAFTFNPNAPAIQLTPPPNSAGIRCSGGGIEAPPPVPNFGTKTGNPLLATFTGTKVTHVASTVTSVNKPGGKAKVLPHAVISPDKPANPGFEGNQICLITNKPLPKKSTINIEIQYTQDGAAKTVSWSFKTSAKGDFDPVAAQASLTQPVP